MLRSIGIPARLGVGYAQGVAVERGKVFEIRSKDSHAWAEVYFPEIGWVIFEPTSAQPAVTFRHEHDVTTEGMNDFSDDLSGGTSGNVQHDIGSGDFSRFDAIEQRLSSQEAFLYDTSIGESSNQWYLILIIWMAIISIISFLLFGRVLYKGKQIPIQRYLIIRMEKRARRVPKWLDDWSAYRERSYIQKNVIQIDWCLRLFMQQETRQMTVMEKSTYLQQFVPAASPQIQTILNVFQDEVYGGKTSDLQEVKICLRELRQAVFISRVKRRSIYLKTKANTP